MDLNKGIFGKGLTPEEAKKKASEAYEKATGKKVGSGTKKDKIVTCLFFGSIILLTVVYLLKFVLPQ